MKKSFGSRLRELRGTSSQAEIARIFGVSGQSWGFYERDQKDPTMATIGKICSHFKVTSDWLLGLSPTAAAPYRSGGPPCPPPPLPPPAVCPAPGADTSACLQIIQSQQATIRDLATALAAARPYPATAPTGGATATKTA